MSHYSLLCDIAACLCAELTPEGAPGSGLCFCGVAPGRTFAEDYIFGCDSKCGAAWVRLITAYPADGPGLRAENPTRCGSFLGADIEVGVIRCVEQESDGAPPTEAAMEDATAQQIADMVAIRKALACCPSLNDLDYSLGHYTPSGPNGAVVGGTWTVSVVFE